MDEQYCQTQEPQCRIIVPVKPHYPWQKQYEAAVLETKHEKIQPRIREAKAAIDARLHEMQLDHGGTPEERDAISDALAGLNVLRREIETRTSAPE